MPEHVHLLVYPRREEYDINKIAGGIKLPVARRAIRFLRDSSSPWLQKITRRRGTRTERLFWQSGGGFDRNVENARTLLVMIGYLHNNPVRRGLVTRARDWKWSSAAVFEGGQSPIAIDPIPWEWLAGV
jgi:putative transposase